MADDTPAYMGRSECGHVNFVVVDRPEYRKDTAKDIARWLRDGGTIERTTVEVARTELTFCDCRKKAKAAAKEAAKQETLL